MIDLKQVVTSLRWGKVFRNIVNSIKNLVLVLYGYHNFINVVIPNNKIVYQAIFLACLLNFSLLVSIY